MTDSPQPTQAWEALKPDDKIYLIAPSTPADKGTVEYAVEMFKAMGLEPVVSPEINVGYHNWGNRPEHAAGQIIEALHTPGVKTIYSLEGGEGASEVVAELKKREPELFAAPNRGIPLIGYSDTTFLHHYLGERGIVSPVQGPVPAYLATNDKEEHNFGPRTPEQIIAAQKNRESLQHFLMDGQASEPPITLQPLNASAKRAEKIEGVLVGGSDQITAMSRFTTYGPHAPVHAAAEKPILLLEGKSLQEMHDTLKLMRESGDLNRYQGIVLGKYYANQEDPNPAFPAHQVTEVLKKAGIDESIPVFHGAPFGHPRRGADMKPIPLYTHTVIAAVGENAVMHMERSGTQQDLNRRAAVNPAVPFVTSGLSGQETDVVTLNMKPNQTLAASVNELNSQNIAGKNVELHFNLDEKSAGNAQAAINHVHFIMAPLIASGKLKEATSLTLSANGDFATEFKEWLKDFSSRQLPNIPVSTAAPEHTENKNKEIDKNLSSIKLDSGDHNNITAPGFSFADALRGGGVRQV